MEVEIISRENIKPATPTPDNLRIHKLSVIDQLCAHAYIPFLLVYSNNESSTELGYVISERRHLLKNSLSETLTRFYPLAGEVMTDKLHIECNDNGVYCVEARISNQLSDFLGQPEAKLMHQLFPYHPDSEELMSKTFVATVQVSIFSCGGITIGIYFTHKIIDACSLASFLKAWAATARGSSDQIIPNFDARHIFPQIPTLPKNASLMKWPPLYQRPKCVPRRFAFDATALVALKKNAAASPSISVKSPSRVVSVIGLIWKCAMVASKSRYGFQKPSILSVAVNLRAKTSLALPNYSIGNIIWFAVAESTPDTELELSSVVGCLQDALTKVDNNLVEELKGEEGSAKLVEQLKKLEQLYSNNDAEYYINTSWCNAGFEEVDFGWGKPIWKSHGAPDSDNPGLTNLIFLTDSDSGDGIEAMVSLCEADMCILEHDPELLAYASIKS